MNKKHGLAGGLALLVGISAYMWLTDSSQEANIQVVHAKESFPCSQCGNQFEMTAEKAMEQFQSGPPGYICPSCNEGGAVRNSIRSTTDEDSDNDQDEFPEPVGVRELVQP